MTPVFIGPQTPLDAPGGVGEYKNGRSVEPGTGRLNMSHFCAIQLAGQGQRTMLEVVDRGTMRD